MADQQQISDDMATAVVELVQRTRNDGRLHDAPPAALRKKIVKAHVKEIATAYGLDAKELALAAATMMSQPSAPAPR